MGLHATKDKIIDDEPQWYGQYLYTTDSSRRDGDNEFQSILDQGAGGLTLSILPIWKSSYLCVSLFSIDSIDVS